MNGSTPGESLPQQTSPIFNLRSRSFKMEEVATDAIVPENCSSSQPPEMELVDRSLEESIVEWSDIEGDDSLQSCNEFEDLLYHFDKFFRSRFDAEMETFRESVNNMLSEQNTHVRQIIQRVGQHCDILNTDMESHDAIESDCSAASDSGCEVAFVTGNKVTNVSPREDTIRYRPQTTTKDRLLVQLMSLSCALTSIFHRKEYKTS